MKIFWFFVIAMNLLVAMPFAFATALLYRFTGYGLAPLKMYLVLCRYIQINSHKLPF